MEYFSWLHFSDLHWGTDDHKDYWGAIEPKMFADFEKLQKRCNCKWDAVFFTGDLVNSGKKAEFDKLTERIQRILDHLKKNNSDPWLMVIPGNHDLVRPLHISSACKCLTQLWDNDDEIRNCIWKKNEESDYLQMIRTAFENFNMWSNELDKLFKIPKPMKSGLLPGEFSVTVQKGIYNIGVIGLNTAFLQLTDSSYREKLDTNPAQMVELCGVNHQDWVDKHDVCFLLTHHPMEWLSPRSKNDFESVISPPGRFALHLCGHQHEALLSRYSSGGADDYRNIECGYSLFGLQTFKNWSKNSEEERRHGYSAGCIYFSDEKADLRIWPRLGKKKQDNAWGFDPDPSFHIEDDGGIKAISLKLKTKRRGSSSIDQTEWPDTKGRDNYGSFADFNIKGIVQRMRLINPGKFMMGSPDDEPERLDYEMHHEVQLTRGFWLADTSCTQALWQAVMDKNPSKFKGAERPVENVSWTECMDFIKKINGLKPGLQLRLPTEAEWEYACRAGTVTPFSFGYNITPDQVNYDGNKPYAGGTKGINRGETVAVKELECNEWGLYQMHGNVSEWCFDWFDDYSTDSVIDPEGPPNGMYRVVRGGSWWEEGSDVRSAKRSRHTRSIRFGPGLRLCRSQ